MKKGEIGTGTGIVIVVLVLLVVGFVGGYISIPEGGGIKIGDTTYFGPTYITNEEFEDLENGLPEGTRVDLRTLLEPLFDAIPGAELECESSGGVWHWEGDWAGCEGSGPSPATCSTIIAQIAIQQCHAVGAVSRCGYGDVYCKY